MLLFLGERRFTFLFIGLLRLGLLRLAGDLRLRTGDLRLAGDLRLGDLRLGDLRLGLLRLAGDLRLRDGDLRAGDLRAGDLRAGDLRLGLLRLAGDLRLREGDLRLGDFLRLAGDLERPRFFSPSKNISKIDFSGIYNITIEKKYDGMK